MWRRGNRAWCVAALLLAAATAGLDALLGRGAVLTGVLVLSPLFAALRCDVRETGAVGGFAVAFAVASGFWNDMAGSVDHLIRIAVVVAGAGLSVWAAKAAREREASHRQDEFLVRMATAVEETLDVGAGLRALAAQTVPAIADRCAVHLRDADGGARLIALASPAGDELTPARRGVRRPTEEPDARHGPGRVVRTGEPELLEAVSGALLRDVAVNEEDLAGLRALGIHSALSVPLRARGDVRGALTVMAAGRRPPYGPDDVPCVEEIADRAALSVDNARLFARARAQEAHADALRLDAEESRTLLDALIDRAPTGVAFFDTDLRYVRVNAALAEINGVPAEDHIGRTVADVLPDQDPAVGRQLAQVLATGDALVDVEVTGVTPRSRDARSWLVSYYRVVLPDSRVLGVGATVNEITDRKRAEAALREQRDLYDTLLRALSDAGEGFLLVERERVVFANVAAERLTGRSGDALLGLGSLLDLVPGAERPRVQAHLERALAGGSAAAEGPGLEVAIHRPDGVEVALDVSVKALPDAPQILVLIARDVTERRALDRGREALLVRERSVREATERAHADASFLSEATLRLESSLDLERSLADLGALVVETIADACEVDVLTLEGRIARLGGVGRRAGADAAMRALPGLAEIDPGGGHPIAVVIRTGRPRVIEAVDDDVRRSLAADEAHLAGLREAEVGSSVIHPLTVGGRQVGALGLGWREPGHHVSEHDWSLQRELARRVALAVDNSRLYQERSLIARTLQASFLPDQLPVIPGIDLAGRFVPARGEIGGDFYAAFRLPGGHWGLVIGDVCGKGAPAAVLTALARHTIAALAMAGAAPEEVLAGLNDAILRQPDTDRFCTAAYVQLDPRGDGAAVRVCVGGHPAPLVRRAGGRVEQAGAAGSLLGVFDRPSLSTVATELGSGDALVLYTDGITDARRGETFLGEDGLERLLGRTRAATAEELVSGLTASVDAPGVEIRDDVAILAAIT